MNPNKYEQAMERVVERDNRIKLLSGRAKSFTSENVELKQLYDKVLQQNHVIKKRNRILKPSRKTGRCVEILYT